MLSGAMLPTVLILTCSPPSSVQHMVAVRPAHTARPKCVDFSDVKACGGVLGTFNDLVGVAEFADCTALSCGSQPVVIGHAYGACSYVRPPEIVGAGLNGTGALDWIGSSLVFTFLEVWLGSSLVFMCLYWLVIKLRDTERNTAELRIAATQSAERYRRACAAAELWRERAIAAQDSAAAETQRTFTLMTEKGCAVRAAAAAEQRLAIERAGRARAAAAAERAAVKASAATAELADIKANAAAAAECAAAKVRCEASVVLANEPIERKRAVERAVAANDEAYHQTYSICSEAIRIVQRKYHEERLALLEIMESLFERQSLHRDRLACESASLSSGSAAEASADQLRARAAAGKVCADQAAKNAIIMAASAERATAVAKTLATVVSRPGLDVADVAITFQSAIADASDAAEHSANGAEYAAAEAGVHAVHASAAADAERADAERAAVGASAAAAAVETSAAADVEPAAVEAITVAAERTAVESREGEPPGRKGLKLDVAEMLIGVAPLSEVIRYISPLAGPLPESLRGLADRDRLTGGTAAAERATVEASTAAAERITDAEDAAAKASAAAEASAASAEADVAVTIERAVATVNAGESREGEGALLVETGAAAAERAAVEASAATVKRAAVKASAADAECDAVGASAAAVERAAVEVNAAATERTAVEASAADAERAALGASTAAAAVERVASVKACGQRASRRGARGGRRAVTRRRSVSCIPPNPIPLVVMLAHEGSRLHRGGKGEPGGIGASEGPSPL